MMESDRQLIPINMTVAVVAGSFAQTELSAAYGDLRAEQFGEGSRNHDHDCQRCDDEPSVSACSQSICILSPPKMCSDFYQ